MSHKLDCACNSFETEEAQHDLRLSALTVLERKELLKLLAERIGQLPEVPKKGLRLADIAACFNLTKTGICQIHAEAVNELRKYVSSIWVERGWNEREDDFSASYHDRELTGLACVETVCLDGGPVPGRTN